ncbi:MAG: tRNA (adenosine(37)-N6)-threonylcarbamoyltransferase complex dimerization subunit type 1 TsaB [Candidatus Omnitrophica bacterium]|nr:tRNA (adenosine(37)-N6)-threonylcarbamoyltransferase complex dimerization subunit type 1 TsaB [Candidatus Omnitrophota bacterium]MDD5592987.1 tRNA (adenosine(37)-N6)-threonylcarbamoyltransferase complex dimerization subunit type 1 TsaB [Candidatus Omnitrophota bacterium]
MKILGIDTTTKFLSLGLSDNTKIYEYNLEAGTKLSALLGITIKRALDMLGWRACDIDYLACGLGPGSFTGVRIGLATIKGMSFALHKPIIGISTLDILAKNAHETAVQIIPVIDAKRGLVYTSVYLNKNGKLKRIRPYMLLAVEDFLKKARADAIIFGDAAGLYRDKILTRIKGVNILDRDCWYPKAHNIMELALEKIKQKQFTIPSKIEPVYLYPKECQIRKQKD